MDSYITLDGQLVISHNSTLDGTTNFGQPGAPAPFNAPGASNKIWDYTLADLKKLDDSYWFAPGSGQYDHGLPAASYELRGVADGSPSPPSGYTANDFKIPTFEEVLEAFPDTRINIDLKDQSGFTAKGIEAAHELADILKAQPGGDNENVLVASFGQAEMEAFNADIPEHSSLSASLDATVNYALGGVPITPPAQALQPPDSYDLSGTIIAAPEFLKTIPATSQYALHVWGADATVEDDALYQRMLDVGVQGFFAQKPSELAAFLCAEGIPRPDGSSHCTSNPDMPGIHPILELAESQAAKAKVKAGKKVVIEVKIENVGNLDSAGVSACATAVGKAERWVKPGRCGEPGTIDAGSSLIARIPIQAKRKARGAYDVDLEVTSDGGSAESALTLRVKNKKRAGSARPTSQGAQATPAD
jgi:glycerophosphoryl diester phosphodiesterase